MAQEGGASLGMSPTAAREIRLFVSSTFRDMQAERDELIKQVFPRLRQRCESRGVAWLEVDLRWGITDEQTAEGQVLPLCLAEIDRCRPFFLGMLGERYGWVPPSLPPNLIEQQPWLAERGGASVTELEIRHGVLNDPAAARHSFFYFRDPLWLDALPPDERSLHEEGPDPLETASLGHERAEALAAGRRARLRALRDEIRASGVSLREAYPSPRTLGDWVHDDLAAAIDRLYPADAAPDPLAQDEAVHTAYARSRSQVYVRRPAAFERLDRAAAVDGAPLVIAGASGAGKSALLANWSVGHGEAVVHFIGAGPRSADWMAMAQRIIGELNRRLGIGVDVPDDAPGLRKAFATALRSAAELGPVVLVIDGLNQLEDRDGALELTWLPATLPPGVRLIVSSLAGRCLDELERRGWQTMRVEPLTNAERRELIAGYLAQFAKALDAERVGRIATCPQAASPLYLRVLLDQVRQHGAHETLDERILDLLEAVDIPALYDKVLAGWERDYEQDRSGLVRDAMTLLWSARRGLSEAELLDLLGDDARLPQAIWTPLTLAAADGLLSRSGLIGFSHEYLRHAVATRYLGDAEDRERSRASLVGYLATRAINQRMIDELPWQLARAGAWDRLARLLGNLPFFAAAWASSPIDVKRYWAQIQTSSPLRANDAYADLLATPAAHPEAAWWVATLLDGLGYPREALGLWRFLVGHYQSPARPGSEVRSVLAAMANMARIQMALGDLDGALTSYLDQERLCRDLGDDGALQAVLGSRALISSTRGAVDEALRLLSEQEAICRRLDNEVWLQASLGNRALVMMNRGELEAAEELLHQQERICRTIGNMSGLQVALGNRALVLRSRGDFAGALRLHAEEEQICRELGHQAGLQATLCNQAQLLDARGELPGAMTLLREAETICRELGHLDGLRAVLGNQAGVQRAWGNFEAALDLHSQEEEICRELGDRAGLQSCLGNQSVTRFERGEIAAALTLAESQAKIARQLESKSGRASALHHSGRALRGLGDLEESAARLTEAMEMWEALGAPLGTQRSLHELAVTRREQGAAEEALALLVRQEETCRELGLLEDLARCLWQQALCLNDLQRQSEAQFVIDEAVSVAEGRGFAALLAEIEPQRRS